MILIEGSMAENYSDLDKRISIIEAEFENMEKAVAKIDENLQENYKLTLQIKERLDKWNGSIPRMSEDIKSIQQTQDDISKSLTKNELSNAKKHAAHETKMKVVWGIVSTIGVALAGYLIKVLLVK